MIKTVITIFLMLLSIQSVAGEFLIQGKRHIFSTIVLAKGSFTIERPFLEIDIPKLQISRNSDSKSLTRVTNFRVGVATDIGGRWKVERWGDEHLLNRLIKPGQTHTIKNYYATIPIDGISDLSSYWIIIQLKLNNGSSTGYTYSHSLRVFLDEG